MHVLVVSNPKAGQGKELLEFIAILEKQARVEHHVLREHERIDLVLRDSSADRIVVAGGDGTIANAAYALRETGIPLAIYPTGTANLAAANLELPNTNEALAKVVLEGNIVKLDLAELVCRKKAHPHELPERKGFLLNAGAGFDAHIVRNAQSLKAKLGSAAYLVAALRIINPPVAKIELTIDGESMQFEGIGVLVLNLGKLHHDLSLAKNTSWHDGKLEVIVIKAKYPAQLVMPLVSALIARKSVDQQKFWNVLEIRHGKHIKVKTEPTLHVQYDGETIPYETPIEAYVLPDAIRVLVSDKYIKSIRK
ncbi:MAG: diacylglycerol kinase family protein [Candidatus Woesearchaeota archaeon]